jgi:uncharacterized protein (TIGR02217 family)
MSLTSTFPKLSGLGWSVTRKPTFKTIISQAVAGQESRLTLWKNPIWEFDLTYEVLSDVPNGGITPLAVIMGFYLQAQGSGQDFLLNLQDLTLNPSDGNIVGQIIGTGDGATTGFQLTRSIGAWREDVQVPNIVSAIYVDDAEVDTGWLVGPNGVIIFAAAPAAGATIKADFSWYYRVRFADDSLDFENFSFLLYQCQQVNLLQVRT